MITLRRLLKSIKLGVIKMKKGPTRNQKLIKIFTILLFY